MLRHVGIVVSNLELVSEMFVSLLGYQVKASYSHLSGEYQSSLVGIENVVMDVTIMCGSDNSRVELLRYNNRPLRTRELQSDDIGCSHIAVTIPSMDDFVSNITQWPVRFVSRPLKAPDGSVSVCYVVFCDEVLVEVVEVHRKSAIFSGGV